MIPLHPQWCCMQSTVLLEGCRTWSTVFSWVLHTEHSALTGCCTQSTVLLQSAAHRAQCSHTGAGLGKQYSYILTGCYTQNTVPLQSAPPRTQYSPRLLHMEQTTHRGDTHRAQYSCNASTGGHTPGVSGRDSSICHCVTQWAV